MKTLLTLLLIFIFSSCSFSYSVPRDCDGKKEGKPIKNHHPKPEWRLGY